MDISGYVVLGIATLFFLYVMPQLIRNRQDVADARVGDRFSADLRILVTAGTAESGAAAAIDDAPRAYLHDPRLRTEVSAMNRPPALVNSTSSAPSRGTGSAQPRPAVDRARLEAARAEARRRRRAAARRRLVLTLLLLVTSGAAWGLFAMGLATWVAGAVPTFLLFVVLVLGRRAAIAGRRAEQATAPSSARPSREIDQPVVKAAPGAAVAPEEAARPVARTAADDATTELIPRLEALRRPGLVWKGEPSELDVEEVRDGAVPIGDAPPTARRAFEPAEGSAWTPVPVPAPTYTLKPTAPRMDAAPLAVEAPAQDASEGADDEATEGRPLDLDAVLARRRAAGE